MDLSDDKEEDFQTVPLDDEHWTSEEIPVRTFCVHEHGLSHGLCPHPCPWATTQQSYLDIIEISDILEYEDYMVTLSDEDTPCLEEVPY